jgi:CheY-like chemotaxis protein
VTGAVLQPEKGQALRILVIDDMATALDLLADGLREFDHTVHTALSGEQGIEMFNRIQVDLVICDLGMPGTSGWDVSKEVMKICQERRVRKTPFLLLTGWGDQVRETDKMNESGVNRIIAKPVGLQKLLEVVGSLVQE